MSSGAPELEWRSMRRWRMTGSEIIEREHRVHARQRQRGILRDAADQRVRMRAAHEASVQHAGHRDVVDEAAVPPQQRVVLEPGDARSDQRNHA